MWLIFESECGILEQRQERNDQNWGVCLRKRPNLSNFSSNRGLKSERDSWYDIGIFLTVKPIERDSWYDIGIFLTIKPIEGDSWYDIGIF